ncbi:hypothetical protein L6164_019361 [Bauhinia variegata]|uniref:Uncharacterized protein n=1 Tax=Bauhinia variegata TaxID=167791 RepID=A0ACB9MSV6_BAUVA|nr:hypothetical protein L6164_019361 [Bauhinia variegata]
MARAAAFFTVFLFLFGLSSARIPVNLPEIDDATTPVNRQYDSFSESRAHPNPTAANTLLLPSENPDSEPEINDSKPEPESQLEASTESEYQVSASDPDPRPSPFTIISSRPINRHIPRRPLPLSYRLGHRCRNHPHFKPWDPLLKYKGNTYG